MDEVFDIIDIVSSALSSLDVPVIEGWYDEDLNKTHITVHEYLSQDGDYEDDEASCIEHNIQVDIWSKNSLQACKLKKKIKILLKNNEFSFSQGQDFYETDTKIYHKAMRFTYTEYM